MIQKLFKKMDIQKIFKEVENSQSLEFNRL